MERHLIIQELALRPSGEWQPDAHAWTIARIAEGAGYSLQGTTARELNAGDMAVIGPATQFTIRASQLGNLKVEFYVVLPQFLNGLVTLAEWRQLEEASKQPYPKLAHFAANEPPAQKFTRLAAQKQRDCLSSRSTMLQLWATSINHLLPPVNTNTGQLVQLRDRFRELIGKMSEAELATRSLSELADKLHCSERHFSRLFRKEFKVSLRERQTELRLQRARQLLTDSNSKIINVAYESGYRHLGLFNAMFKRRFGLTPSAWRQKNSVPAGDPNFARRNNMVLVTLLLLLQVFFSTNITAQTTPNTTAAVTTNAAPKFRVTKYLVTGNSVLPADQMGLMFTNVPGAFGDEVTFDDIRHALGQLQTGYRERGFVTISVGLPPQKLTNGIVKVRVTEGRLADIQVQGNKWFSTPNVLRALPSLHTNMLLNSHVFQTELDLANASRDRQIYPVIGPGFEPGTSELTLKVKDNFPLHARVEWNNTGTVGTPPDRVAANAQYDNLWQLEQQIGAQYSFSPLDYKNANPYGVWDPDLPLIANYSLYYRIPLGQPQSLQQQIDQSNGKFGYNESTHQFVMPPSTGAPELTFYGTRATSDTGVILGQITPVIDSNGNLLGQQPANESVTLNEGLGMKLSMPLPQIKALSSTAVFGFDYKHYEARNAQDELLRHAETITNGTTVITYGNVFNTIHLPVGNNIVDYFPLSLAYSGSVPDSYGSTSFNIQGNYNIATVGSLADIAYSAALPDVISTNSHTHTLSTNSLNKARDNYYTVTAGVTREQRLYKDWMMLMHADGQWASCPLISNEQYELGGSTTVRGYSEGEAYGDVGWRVTLEPQTPMVNIGMVDGDKPFFMRGSVFMDYGQGHTVESHPAAFTRQAADFWGSGFALSANIGSHIDARLTIAFPLISAASTSAGDVHIYFAVGGQL